MQTKDLKSGFRAYRVQGLGFRVQGLARWITQGALGGQSKPGAPLRAAGRPSTRLQGELSSVELDAPDVLLGFRVLGFGL